MYTGLSGGAFRLIGQCYKPKKSIPRDCNLVIGRRLIAARNAKRVTNTATLLL
jgi:hypothetical protein